MSHSRCSEAAKTRRRATSNVASTRRRLSGSARGGAKKMLRSQGVGTHESVEQFGRIWSKSPRFRGQDVKLLCFEWSPPWHSIHPIWHSVWLIYLAFHLACLLTFYLAYLSGIPSGMSYDILSAIRSGMSYDILFCGISSGILSGISSDILYLAFSLAFYMALFLAVEVRLRSGEAHGVQNLAAHCDRELAVGVRRGPLRSRAGRWGPARPTAIKRSGEAHCDRELAEEVRRGPLRSRAGRGRRRRRRRRRRSRASDIKSNNPHLAGGEKTGFQEICTWTMVWIWYGKGLQVNALYLQVSRLKVELTWASCRFASSWIHLTLPEWCWARSHQRGIDTNLWFLWGQYMDDFPLNRSKAIKRTQEIQLGCWDAPGSGWYQGGAKHHGSSPWIDYTSLTIQ